MRFVATRLGRFRPGGTPARDAPGEAAFVARLRAGDEAAYRELVARQHNGLLMLARTILRNPASAEEAVQETWLAVVAHIGSFEGRSRLSTWIVEILLNKARSRASQEGRWVGFADLVGPSTDDGEDGERLDRFLPDGHWAEPVASWEHLDPERIVAGRELWSHVARALDDLPGGQRAVVVLRDVDGLDLDEIGRLLGLTPANVRVLLHRGRSRLRRVIEALQQLPEADHAGVNKPNGPSRNGGPAAQSNETEPPSSPGRRLPVRGAIP